MANFHARSNSFPSQSSHPVIECVEEQLCRLKSSQATSTSTASLCTNLAALGDLHEGINDLIQMPSIRQVLSREQGEDWMNELLEGSLRLVDLCGFSRDVVCLTKGSVQDLKSAIRRNKGKTAAASNFNAYAASRKKINKMSQKCIKSLKSFNQKSTVLTGNDRVRTMLKDTQALDSTVLKSVLMALYSCATMFGISPSQLSRFLMLHQQ